MIFQKQIVVHRTLALKEEPVQNLSVKAIHSYTDGCLGLYILT